MGELTAQSQVIDVAVCRADPFVSHADGFEIAGYAPRTLEALRAGWRVWLAASEVAGVSPLPADERVMLAEILRRVEAGHSRATIETSLLFPLRAAHKRAGLTDPTRSVLFLDFWKKLCRERLIARQAQAVGLGNEHLLALDRVLDSTAPRDCLMGAICGVAYDAMLRVSELVLIEHRNIIRARDGSAILVIPRSKTDQDGRGFRLLLRTRTVRWIDAHSRFTAAKEPAGSWLFPSPYRRGKNAISTRQAAALMLEAGRRVGVDGLSGHSARVGATQDMANAGASLPLVQRQGRWKTSKQPARYAENADAAISGKARFDLLNGGNVAEALEKASP